MRILRPFLLVFTLLLGAICLLGILLPGAAPGIPGRGGGVPAARNGDTNGDGDIDISDAVYLLLFLFRDGEPPVAMADSPELLARVEAVEDGLGALLVALNDRLERIAVASERPCEERPGRFVDNGDGTVTDNCTGLMWQQVAADVNQNGSVEPQGDRVSQAAAAQFAAGLQLAGHDDWRLPRVEELATLLVEGSAPAIDPVFGVNNDRYWTSTINPIGFGLGWVVDFRTGLRSEDPLTNGNRLLAVREP